MKLLAAHGHCSFCGLILISGHSEERSDEESLFVSIEATRKLPLHALRPTPRSPGFTRFHNQP